MFLLIKHRLEKVLWLSIVENLYWQKNKCITEKELLLPLWPFLFSFGPFSVYEKPGKATWLAGKLRRDRGARSRMGQGAECEHKRLLWVNEHGNIWVDHFVSVSIQFPECWKVLAFVINFVLVNWWLKMIEIEMWVESSPLPPAVCRRKGPAMMP